MTSRLFGGFGGSAVGRTPCGGSLNDIPPSYDESLPLDNAKNVARNQYVIFETYFYSSTPDFPDGFLIELSEDGGVNFHPVVPPEYEITLQLKDSQQVWCKIRKTSTLWPERTKIVVRCTTADEYGNVVVKNQALRWPG